MIRERLNSIIALLKQAITLPDTYGIEFDGEDYYRVTAAPLKICYLVGYYSIYKNMPPLMAVNDIERLRGTQMYYVQYLADIIAKETDLKGIQVFMENRWRDLQWWIVDVSREKTLEEICQELEKIPDEHLMFV